MYAFVAIDPEDNTEGVCAFFDPTQKSWVPMVGADMDRAESMRPVAKQLAKNGVKIKLVKFTTRTELETIEQ